MPDRAGPARSAATASGAITGETGDELGNGAMNGPPTGCRRYPLAGLGEGAGPDGAATRAGAGSRGGRVGSSVRSPAARRRGAPPSPRGRRESRIPGRRREPTSPTCKRMERLRRIRRRDRASELGWNAFGYYGRRGGLMGARDLQTALPNQYLRCVNPNQRGTPRRVTC